MYSQKSPQQRMAKMHQREQQEDQNNQLQHEQTQTQYALQPTPPPSYDVKTWLTRKRQSRRLVGNVNSGWSKSVLTRFPKALKAVVYPMIALNVMYPLFTNTGLYDKLFQDVEPTDNRGDIDFAAKAVLKTNPDQQYPRKVIPMNRGLFWNNISITDPGREDIVENLYQSPHTFLSLSHLHETPVFWRESKRQRAKGNRKGQVIALSGAALNFVAAPASIGTGTYEIIKRRFPKTEKEQGEKGKEK